MVLILLSACHSTAEREQSTAALYHMQLGLTYLQQGDRPKAKQQLWQALAQAPRSTTVNGAMAYYLEKTGEQQAAQSYYQKAMQLAPHAGGPLSNYGAFLCRHQDYQAADYYFMQAVKDSRYEHTAAVYENAGLCALLIPDNKKAKHYFRLALKHDPARKQARLALARLHPPARKTH